MSVLTLWGRLLRILAVLLASGFASCELAVDVSSLDNGQCLSSQKACMDRCVSKNDPKTGCALLSCAPCALANAVARCGGNGQCTIAACIGTFHDCDLIAADGCEVDTDHDPDHCGTCSAAHCVTPNGTPGCSDGRCATGGCDASHADCDDDPRNGCEVDLGTDSQHCGKCKNPCLNNTVCAARACVSPG